MKIQSALVSHIFDRSQRYFAHVTTVTLSWRVQNIVVIGRVYFTLERSEFSSNFEFDRNMLSGTGAWLIIFPNFVAIAIICNPNVNIGDFTFETCERALRHQNTRELPFKQRPNILQVRSMLKRKYITVVYNLHLRWKRQCATEIPLLNTPHDRHRCHQADDPILVQLGLTHCLPQKVACAL